jgi:glucokinase
MQNQAFFLAAGLTSVVNLLNPDVIVIGGGMIDAADGLIEQVRKEFTSRAMHPMNDHVTIVPAQFGNRAGIIGAGLLSLKASGRRPYSHA